MYFVYILKCRDNTFYTGITTNVARRLTEHNTLDKGARYTKARRPVELVYIEKQKDRSKALKREMIIKKMTRAQKFTLIVSRTSSRKKEDY